MAHDADQDLKLWQQLERTQRRVSRNLNRTLWKQLGYPPHWIDFLMALAESAGSQDQMMDVADQLGVTPSGLTVLADQLADADLIRRERNPADRRRTLITITPHGRRELGRAVLKYREGMRQTGLGGLSVAEARALGQLLAKVEAPQPHDAAMT